MANKYGYMAKIGIDSSGLQKGLKDADSAISSFSQEMKAVNSVIAKGGDSAEMAAQKNELYANEIAQLNNKLKALRSAEEDVNKARENKKISEKEYREYRREIESTEASIRNLAEEQRKFNDTADDGAEKVSRFGDVLKANIATEALKALTDILKQAAQAMKDYALEGIELASDLTEKQNVIDVTFGSGSSKIYEFADTAAEKFGMTKLAAEGYAGTMGALFKSSGITDGIEDMSIKMSQLAGDMASFYNISSDTAFEKLRAGISGESEPLKQLGINLSVANLEAYALSEGITKAWKDMSQAEQTMLRYNYILQQSADAQGDFERTSDSFANQQRILELNMQSVKAMMGEELIPVMQQFISALNDGLPDIASMLAEGADPERAAEILGGFADELLDGLEDITSIIQESGDNVRNLIAGMGDSTSDLAQGAVDVLTVFCEEIIQSLPDITNVAFRMIEGLAAGIADALPSLTPAAVEAVIGIVETIADNLSMVVDAATDIINGLAEGIGLALPMLLQKAPEIIIKLVSALVESIPSLMTVPFEIGESIRKGLVEYDWIKGAREAVDGIRDAILDCVITNNSPFAYIGRLIMKNINEGMTSEDISAGAGVTSGTWELQEGLWDEAEAVEEAAEEYGQMSKSAAEFMAETARGNAEAIKAAEQQAAEEAKKAQEEAWEAVVSSLDDLDSELAKHKLTEEDYWSERKTLLEANRDEESEEWWKYYDEVTDYYDKLSETEKAAAEKAASEAEKTAKENYQKRVEALETMQAEMGYSDEWYLDELKKIIDSLDKSSELYASEYSKYSQKQRELIDKNAKEEADAWKKSAEEISEAVKSKYDDVQKEFEKSKDGYISALDLTEEITEAGTGDKRLIFNDVSEQTSKLHRYRENMAKLEQTGISEEYLNQIKSMSYDDRSQYVEELLKLSPKNLQKHYSDIEKYYEEARLAGLDDTDDMKAEAGEMAAQAEKTIETSLNALSPQAYESGKSAAEEYIRGFNETMSLTDILLGTETTAKSSSKSSKNDSYSDISADTPVTIALNIDGKQFASVVNITINDFFNAIRNGGGTINV